MPLPHPYTQEGLETMTTLDMNIYMPELKDALDGIVAVLSDARRGLDRKASGAAARKGAKQDRQIGALLDVLRQLGEDPSEVTLSPKALDALRECLSIEVRRRKRQVVELVARRPVSDSTVTVAYAAKELLEDCLDALTTMDREGLYRLLFDAKGEL